MSYFKIGGALVLACVILGLAAWGYKQRGDRIEAEARAAVFEQQRNQAVKANESLEKALTQFRELARERAESLTARLAEANRRAAAAGKTRLEIVHEGAVAPIGPGMAAYLRSRMRGDAAGAGDGNPAGGGEAGPGGP